MGVVQHQAPDTTSPSPPHPYSTNGNGTSTVGNFPQDGTVPLWAQSASSALCKFAQEKISLNIT